MQNIKENVMEKITSEEVKMKPKYYFVLASAISLIGLIALVISSVFLISIISFLLRSHGPMGEVRLSFMLKSFPIWIPIIAVLGILGGIYLLKKYEFSYKRNIWVIIGGFIIAVIISGILLDFMGLDNLWLKRGPMREYMRQYMLDNNLDYPNNSFGPGRGNGYGRFREFK